MLLSIGLGSCSPEQRPGPAETTGPARKTNVLLITIDTLRADYLGCYGRSDIATPVIDGLAAGGVRFEQAVAQAPLTTPSHASILTGTYPPLHKIRDVGGFVLNKEVPTMAELMSAAGFDTAAFVGAAVLNRRYGLDRGFKIYNDDMGSRQEDQKLPGVVAEVRGDIVTQRAIDWLENRSAISGQRSAIPFLLWVHYYDPHFPYDPPEPYRQRYAKDGYAGEVAYTDELIGRLLKS
ncbi:MAG: sulfatase, partial [Acidobacteriota bacterium]